MDEWTKHLSYQKGVVNWIAYAKDGADGGGDDVEIGACELSSHDVTCTFSDKVGNLRAEGYTDYPFLDS